MRLEPPSWWYNSKSSPIANALRPLSWVWGTITGTRMSAQSRYHASLPVICVGNFTMGGAGKTPTAIFISDYLKSRGEQPAFLSRGYGGTLKGPHMVNTEVDSAARVGDEPLLLARHAPTVIAQNRIEGAAMLETSGATAIIMDDGFQNTALHKDLATVVIDGGVGIGNAMVAPSGPLRAPIEQQHTMCDAIIILGNNDPEHDSIKTLRQTYAGPILSAQIIADDDTTWMENTKIIAFAGIGRPEKFFQTVRKLTPNLIDTLTFPDHHNFTEKDAKNLLARAFAEDAVLLTTEKDWVRLPTHIEVLNELRQQSHTLPIRLEFDGDDETELAKLVDIALSTRKTT